ncbi:hypothetical protein NU726_000481 [Vibrio vulnificus]|nr:hypothetical protein [Vibrio vulnificus]HDY7865684.1 hypothetical protein [Vibrio vulnificus]
MSDLIIDNAKYSQWKDSHNFDNCKLNRKEYGEFLADYITGEYKGFVLNLNGSWGTGKTEFLKRLYTELLTRNHPVVYVDAWESDFSKDPLTVVTSELLTQLEKFNNGIGSEAATRTVKEFCGKALKGALVGLAGVATAKLLNDSNIGMEGIKQLLEGDSQSFTKQLTEDYTEQVEAIHKIRESLGQLAEVLQQNYGAELPVIVLVDELDRCRPTYAIEMLEVIKHFFTTDNFVFVVATDTEQLCHSITAVYGEQFDSLQYLKRFFDRKASLPTPDIEHYINATNPDYSPYSELELFPSIRGNSQSKSEIINSTVTILSKAYNLKIRDADQLLNKMHSCLRAACSAKEKTNKAQFLNLAALIIGLIEQDKGLDSFNERDDFYRIYSNPINSKVEISHDLSVQTFIEMAMNCVVMTKNRGVDRYERAYIDESLPTYQEMNAYKSQNSSFELLNLISSFTNKIESFKQNKDRVKYWMWSDLKKVIELSGNIE